jgi:hypothetical protein
MVSEWMDNGNIIEFIEKYKYVNRTELVRHPADSHAHKTLLIILFSWLMLRMVWRICMASGWFTEI